MQESGFSYLYCRLFLYCCSKTSAEKMKLIQRALKWNHLGLKSYYYYFGKLGMNKLNRSTSGASLPLLSFHSTKMWRSPFTFVMNLNLILQWNNVGAFFNKRVILAKKRQISSCCVTRRSLPLQNICSCWREKKIMQHTRRFKPYCNAVSSMFT